ncbi:HesA/MoeB/ThiF family protein [Thioclava atlantica]|uniref:Thiamin biosynthesis protein ThiF n=1 Tax=Thioclava atlantica TaxID=1317124 RepID=A0A085TU20_9RHOB|nr:HesA/MoeB/ThiF family protein [Thioclava atlantica]KFE34217.1 thiamin biosynthesis protein ThiF [Thioclava atlantica]
MSRYARQTCLPEIGTEGQARLAQARVLVIGAGGLGASVLPLLAGAGVGALRVIDPDRVEESNLHRQTLFRMGDLGRPKAEIAAESLRALNPDCEVSPGVFRLDPANARAELARVDLVIDAADSFAVTYALSDLCHARGLPLVSASVLGRSGYAGGFCGGAPSYRAVFPDLPPALQNCASAGVMGPAVASLGALQAQMALSVLLGHVPSPLGQLVSVDLATWRFSGFRFDGAPEPGSGSAVIALREIRPEDVVIDLRGEAEAPAPAHPRALRLSPEAVAAFQPDPGQRAVFVCATGLRAWCAATVLAARGPYETAIVAVGS